MENRKRSKNKKHSEEIVEKFQATDLVGDLGFVCGGDSFQNFFIFMMLKTSRIRAINI